MDISQLDRSSLYVSLIASTTNQTVYYSKLLTSGLRSHPTCFTALVSRILPIYHMSIHVHVKLLQPPSLCPVTAASFPLSSYCSLLPSVQLLQPPSLCPVTAASFPLPSYCSLLPSAQLLQPPSLCPVTAASFPLPSYCSLLPSAQLLQPPSLCPVTAASFPLSSYCSLLPSVQLLQPPSLCPPPPPPPPPPLSVEGFAFHHQTCRISFPLPPPPQVPIYEQLSLSLFAVTIPDTGYVWTFLEVYVHV